MSDHGKHRVPVFGCKQCIADRDAWVCRCGDVRDPSSTYCPVCKRRNPRPALPHATTQPSS